MNRQLFLAAGLACLLSGAARAEGNYLLIDASEIEAARAKAERLPWAQAARDAIIESARNAAAKPVRLPDRGGQWPHWYSCRLDGNTLRTVSPTEHRCPKCGAVYHGEPYDSVVLYREHSNWSRAIRDLGLAYRFTGRPEFARQASAILTAYADRYRTYARHNVNGEDKVGGGRIMAQTLDESVWLIPAAFGFALVRDTLDEAARRHIEQDLLIPAADVIREHRMGIHNIQCWKNSAVGVVGFATGTQALIREAIDDPDRGFRAQIARGVTDDGLWYEGSMGYHQYTMEALWPLAEAARHNGVDLYTERFRSLFDAPLALALPNGDAPGFNDNAGGNVLRSGSLYELAYARWKTPAYGRLVARSERRSLQALLYGVETVPEGPMIPEESVLMRAAGFAMLRAPGMAAAVRFGMHGGGHGHPDKLNLVTFAAGQLFGLDPGSINYGVPLHREWYRSTIAHNTVSVDHQLQANADGKLESWETVGGVTTFAASADDVYPGVKLRRTIRLGDGRIEDRFECASEQEHTYDWSFHAPGKFESSLTFSPAGTPPGTDNGYQHLEKAAAARASGDWWARWEAGGVQMTLTVKGAPGTEVFTALGPGRNPADRVPMVIIRRRGTKTVFECTHTKN